MYKADGAYVTGGLTAVRPNTLAIANTSDPALYRTERYGTFEYNYPIANGTYNIALHFAETYLTASGQRIFSFTVNGVSTGNIDVVAQAGAANKALIVNVPNVSVTNGNLKITSVKNVQEPILNAIGITTAVVTPPPPPPVRTGIRVNCGNTAAHTTADGIVFAADSGYGAGSAVFTTTNAIANTTEDALYQKERYSAAEGGAFTYTFNVTGNKDVILHFSELVYSSTSTANMDVRINNVTVLDDYKVISDTPGGNTKFYAFTKQFLNIAPLNGQIKIDFDANIGRAKIAAIEILDI
jgi:hypothetical protein